MTIITPIFDRVELLPFYLRYYAGKGVDRFVVGLHNGMQNPLHDEIIRMANAARVELHIRPSIICPPDQYNGPAETPGLNQIRQEFIKPSEWYLIADLDEFVYLESDPSFDELLRYTEESGFQAAQGVMVDRVAANGQFPELLPGAFLDDQFPVACELTRCGGANYGKVSAARGYVPIVSGHHHVDLPHKAKHGDVQIHHFKWMGDLKQRLAERLMSWRKQGLPWAEEIATIMRLTEHGVDLKDPNYKAREAAKLGV